MYLHFFFFLPVWNFRSAFFIFCADFRPKVKGETPGLSIGDVAKKLGEMWNGTSPEDKQPYEKKAAKLKEKYEKVNLENGHVCHLQIMWLLGDGMCKLSRVNSSSKVHFLVWVWV